MAVNPRFFKPMRTTLRSEASSLPGVAVRKHTLHVFDDRQPDSQKYSTGGSSLMQVYAGEVLRQVRFRVAPGVHVEPRQPKEALDMTQAGHDCFQVLRRDPGYLHVAFEMRKYVLTVIAVLVKSCRSGGRGVIQRLAP